MAFEIPSHLRKTDASPPTGSTSTPAGDVSSSSSSPPTASSSAHVDTLLAPLLKEKWSTLTSDKVRIHKERVHKDAQETKSNILKLVVQNYPDLTSQLNGSLDARSRTAELDGKVTGLEGELDGDPTSLLPPLVATLRSHSSLLHSHAQTSHRQIILDLLHAYRTSFTALLSATSLEASVKEWKVCEQLLNKQEWSWGNGGLKSGLRRDLENRLRVERDRMAEELGSLWKESVTVGWSEGEGVGVLTVKEPEKMSMASLLEALSTLSTLLSHVTLLTTQLLSTLIRPILSAPAVPSPSSAHPSPTRYTSTSTSTDGRLSIFRISLSPPPPSASTPWTTLPSTLPLLTSLLDFLSATSSSSPRLQLPPLPTLLPSIIPLVRTLHLEPSLPNLAPETLPDFIATCRAFADFEDSSSSPSRGELRDFERGAGTKWVRWRRGDVLGRAREAMVDSAEAGWEGWEWIRDRVVDEGEPEPVAEERAEVAPGQVAPVPERMVVVPSPPEEPPKPTEEEPMEEDGWGFDEDDTPAPAFPPAPQSAPEPEGEDEDDGWGFASTSPPKPSAVGPPRTTRPVTRSHKRNQSIDADGWGFGSNSDDEDSKPIIAPAPRQARHLGKARSKAFGGGSPARSGSGSTTTSSSFVDVVPEEESPLPSPSPGGSIPAKKVGGGGMKLGSKRQASVSSAVVGPEVEMEEAVGQIVEEEPPKARRGPVIVRERMVVSRRSRVVVDLAEAVKKEVEGLKGVEHQLVGSSETSTSSPSTTLSRAIPDIFSLYRALMPVSHPAKIREVPALAMQFANDCEWLAGEARRLEGGSGSGSGEGKMREMGERWFGSEVSREVSSMMEILDEARHFADVSQPQRSEDLEMCLKRVVFKMELLGRVYKPVLSSIRTQTALGTILNAVLGRMLDEIIGLQDITTKESSRLNEACRMIHPLEELFVEAPGQPSSVVAFVPLWLKFCYLSELLEASIADISYLFETGALIDFTVDELVSLLRALFSDTSLRANTIDKIVAAGNGGGMGL